jgi:hypothetical protein
MSNDQGHDQPRTGEVMSPSQARESIVRKSNAYRQALADKAAQEGTTE